MIRNLSPHLTIGGLAYDAKNNHDRAIADFNEAIRLNPKYTFAFNNRGNAYDAKNDHDRAIADYTEAIRLDPKYHTPSTIAAILIAS